MNLIFKRYETLTKEETLKILDLRNKDYVRKNMTNDKIITTQNHLKWVNTLSNDNSKEYFALILNNEIVGACYWIKEDEKVFWGIFSKENLNPIVTSTSAYLFLDYLFTKKEFETVESYVKKTNQKAYNFTKSLGFTQVFEDEEFYYFSLDCKKWQNDEIKAISVIKRYLVKIEHSFQ